jgi:hypothetical protein
MRLIALAAFLAAGTSPKATAQQVPQIVRDGLKVRLPSICWQEPEVTRDSIAYWHGLQLFVGRCTSYFGSPQSAVVAMDSTGVFYLLDSPMSFTLLEQRLGRPVIDSSNVVHYSFDVARLSGTIDWDAQLVTSLSSFPNPSRLAPTFPTHGTCSVALPHAFAAPRRWEVSFHAATPWVITRVRVETFGDTALLIQGEVLCNAMHVP